MLQQRGVQSQQPLSHMPPGLLQTHMVHRGEYVLNDVSVEDGGVILDKMQIEQFQQPQPKLVFC